MTREAVRAAVFAGGLFLPLPALAQPAEAEGPPAGDFSLVSGAREEARCVAAMRAKEKTWKIPAGLMEAHARAQAEEYRGEPTLHPFAVYSGALFVVHGDATAAVDDLAKKKDAPALRAGCFLLDLQRHAGKGGLDPSILVDPDEAADYMGEFLSLAARLRGGWTESVAYAYAPDGMGATAHICRTAGYWKGEDAAKALGCAGR